MAEGQRPRGSLADPEDAEDRGAEAPPHLESSFSDLYSHATRDLSGLPDLAETAEKVGSTVSKVPILGDIQHSINSVVDSVRRKSAQTADDIIALNAGKMINSIGATLLNSLHDHAMPRGVHHLVDASYGHLWPQAKKSLLDSVMLDLGLEFKEGNRWQVRGGVGVG